MRLVLHPSRNAGLGFLLALLATLAIAMSPTYADEPAAAASAGQQPAAEEALEEQPPPDPITNAKPVDPQPADDALTPGLAVTYFFEKFYTLSEVAEAEDGVPGEPLATLDFLTEDGDGGKALGTDQSIMVGALIGGLMRFPETGTYLLRVNSNDGISVTIGGELVWIDPEVHYHRSSPPIEFVVSEPGWYEIALDYFQKKGGAALQLFWTPPGASEAIVPPEAFAHQQ
jgi:hypothetical protein